MYEKFLIVASKKDKAGINITTQLSKFGTFDFYLTDEDMLYNENVDLMRFQDYDFIIFASKHASEKKEKTICMHVPGNWEQARAGGSDKNVCLGSALFNKEMFSNLNKQIEKHNLSEKYKVTMEVTHHGPFIQKPCLFVEIGSTDTEWSDRPAAFAVAKAIQETIENYKEDEYKEVAIAVGGRHYCPAFNKLQLKSNAAIAHVIPGYVEEVTPEMIKEAMQKTDEEVDFAIIDWKGLKSRDRERAIAAIEANYLPWKKSGEVV